MIREPGPATKREPGKPTPRGRMSKARAARITADNGGRCCWQGGCDSPGPYEIDHIICLALWGPDEDGNCRPLCVPHHKIKTALDKKLLAKAKRNEAWDLGTRRPRKEIPGRSFPAGKQTIPSRPFPKRKK